VIADRVIDRDADWKGDTSVHGDTIDLFGVELGASRRNDGVTKLAEIQYRGTWNTLRDDSRQGQIDNLGGFLVLGTDVA
jgi:hypothetical protein